MEKSEIKVLDHGYIKLVGNWGSDEEIIAAARMSTDGAFRGWGPRYKCKGCHSVNELDWEPVGADGCSNCGLGSEHVEKVPGDEKLLAYLYRNRHSTPFEMAGLTVEVQAPIIVYRQWHRHRTQSYNELSARYTPMPNLNYIPTLERLLGQHKISTNKQAGTIKGANYLSERSAELFQEDLAKYYDAGEELYQKHLKNGIPKELARLFITVGRYSRMRASANLRNWLAFLRLRMDSHAQHEIGVFAEAIGGMISQLHPRTWDLFMEDVAK